MADEHDKPDFAFTGKILADKCGVKPVGGLSAWLGNHYDPAGGSKNRMEQAGKYCGEVQELGYRYATGELSESQFEAKMHEYAVNGDVQNALTSKNEISQAASGTGNRLLYGLAGAGAGLMFSNSIKFWGGMGLENNKGKVADNLLFKAPVNLGIAALNVCFKGAMLVGGALAGMAMGPKFGSAIADGTTTLGSMFGMDEAKAGKIGNWIRKRLGAGHQNSLADETMEKLKAAAELGAVHAQERGQAKNKLPWQKKGNEQEQEPTTPTNEVDSEQKPGEPEKPKSETKKDEPEQPKNEAEKPQEPETTFKAPTGQPEAEGVEELLVNSKVNQLKNEGKPEAALAYQIQALECYRKNYKGDLSAPEMETLNKAIEGAYAQYDQQFGKTLPSPQPEMALNPDFVNLNVADIDAISKLSPHITKLPLAEVFQKCMSDAGQAQLAAHQKAMAAVQQSFQQPENPQPEKPLNDYEQFIDEHTKAQGPETDPQAQAPAEPAVGNSIPAEPAVAAEKTPLEVIAGLQAELAGLKGFDATVDAQRAELTAEIAARQAELGRNETAPEANAGTPQTAEPETQKRRHGSIPGSLELVEKMYAKLGINLEESGSGEIAAAVNNSGKKRVTLDALAVNN